MLRGKIIESNMPSTKISLHTMSIKPYDIRLEVVVQWLLRALNIIAFYNNWSKLPISPENHLFLLSESSKDETVFVW